MNEKEIINKFFKPLSLHTGILPNYDKGKNIIGDDICYCDNYAISSDHYAEDVHFFKAKKSEDYFYIGTKILHASFSDLIAKGLEPKFFIFNLVLTAKNNDEDISFLQKAIIEFQKKFHVTLLGGDLVIDKGDKAKFHCSLCVFARDEGFILTNKNDISFAKDDQLIFQIGNIGGAFEYYKNIKNKELINDENDFKKCYYAPELYADYKYLIDLVSASTDISDGLLLEVDKIAKASNLFAYIAKDKIKFHPKLKITEKNYFDYACFGDDYGIIFTCDKKNYQALMHRAKIYQIDINLIGILKDNKFNNNKYKNYEHNVFFADLNFGQDEKNNITEISDIKPIENKLGHIF